MRLQLKAKLMMAGTILFILTGNATATTPYAWLNIPHMAFGGGYTTYLTIGDAHGLPSDQSTITVYLYGNDGSPLVANVSGFGQVSTFTFSLSPFEQRSFSITGTTVTVSGWIEIGSAGVGYLNASARFVSNIAGNITDVVGILPVEPNLSWTASAEKQSSSDDIGVAVVNPWNNVPITVVFELYQGATRVSGTTQVSRVLNPHEHYAAFVSGLFGNVYSGVATLKISSSTYAFCAVALRADGTQYSSLPTAAGVQLWNWSFADSGGTPYTGQWSWRSNGTPNFYGFEQNSFNTNLVPVAGVFTGAFFNLAWYFYSSNGSYGSFLFQGSISSDGKTINGMRMYIYSDGTVYETVPFTATRAY